jgi:hypothetical protein
MSEPKRTPRQHDRRVPAHPVRVDAETEFLAAHGEARNLSPGGACLALDREFAVGDELIVWLSFARGRRRVPATGRVVWSTMRMWGRPRYGVEWTHLGPQRRWIDWLTEA